MGKERIIKRNGRRLMPVSFDHDFDVEMDWLADNGNTLATERVGVKCQLFFYHDVPCAVYFKENGHVMAIHLRDGKDLKELYQMIAQQCMELVEKVDDLYVEAKLRTEDDNYHLEVRFYWNMGEEEE